VLCSLIRDSVFGLLDFLRRSVVCVGSHLHAEVCWVHHESVFRGVHLYPELSDDWGHHCCDNLLQNVKFFVLWDRAMDRRRRANLFYTELTNIYEKIFNYNIDI
jgi:hypothetical protein